MKETNSNAFANLSNITENHYDGDDATFTSGFGKRKRFTLGYTTP